ncbi:hypothetical protein Nepgr_004259 [Nepenthes gracilis]|uniref:Formin-like protein n=1 Tax=Nepenthes gracilis TaxID=150966 RepID=A0AAD3S113_NEPGR|nr:hypothetical protein Nepgr_004259 [Nepenthes gracilis]
MPTRATTIFIFFLVLLILCVSIGVECSLSSATLNPSRRILHQPFFPLDSPPSQPPSSPPPPPPIAKYPFSGSIPNQSPFFPSYPSPPPPPSPPSLSAFASFPANISSLILPRSPSSKPISRKLVAVTVGLSSAAAVVASIAVFFYLRGRKQNRRRHAGDDKESGSGNGGAFASEMTRNVAPPPRKQRTASNTSSDFLYLGTLMNSRSIDGSGGRGGSGNSGGGSGSQRTLEPRKLDSPELQPLPPLGQRQSYWNAEAAEEEFYSPRGSASGRGSSGSGSQRVLAAVQTENLANNENSFSSSSSSTCSPARSISVSISPPVSNSPKSSKPKTPELVEMQQAPFAVSSPPLPPLSFLLSPPDSSPERGLEKIKEEESPLLSNASRSSRMSSPVESPRLSTLSLSAIKPSPASTHSTPSRPLSNASTPSRKSSSSLRFLPFFGGKTNCSPESSKFCNSPVASPDSIVSPISFTSSSSKHSPRILSSSPRQSEKSYPASPTGRNLSSSPSLRRLSNVSDRNKPSPARISTGSQQPACVQTPPPPPPPLPQMRRCDSPPRISNPAVAVAHPSKPMPSEYPAPVATTVKGTDDTPKPKLKPLHWDKVKATSDREMVWDQLKSSSFKLNEKMIETLFVVNAPNSNRKETTKKSILPSSKQESKVLDLKKAQNIAILLRALNVTVEEVCEALSDGDTDKLGADFLESLSKMAPTKEEARKLKEHKDDSPVKLGPPERFLKSVIEVPFAFRRVEAMLYVANFEYEVEFLKKSFETLEAACDELRSSRMFLKLLEAILKTGNRMNDGTNRGDAHAFKLDTLLKLVDVKGSDGRTTLLHFVVQEIIRSEGARIAINAGQTLMPTTDDDAKCRKLGLQVVSSLSLELGNVKRAAAMDSDVLSNELSKLFRGLANIGEVVRLNEGTGLQSSSRRFSESMNQFKKMAEEEIIRVQAQESVALSLVKEITEYFHGNSAKEEAHPFRIFMVIRDFLTVLDRVCQEVGMVNERMVVSSVHKFPVPVNLMLPVPVNPTAPRVFAGFRRESDSSSSDKAP